MYDSFSQLILSHAVRPNLIGWSLTAQSYSLDCLGGSNKERSETGEEDYREDNQQKKINKKDSLNHWKI